MSRRRRETWTFQPDSAEIEMMNSIFGRPLDRGERTQLIHEALRFAHPETIIIQAENEVREAQFRLERVRKIIENIKNRRTRQITRNDTAPYILNEAEQLMELPDPDDVARATGKLGIQAGDNPSVSSKKSLADEHAKRVLERHPKRNDPPK